MSQENVEVVRRVYEAVARGDRDAVLALYDPDVELDLSRSPFAPLLNRSVYRGHEGIRSLHRERQEEAWKEVVDTLNEVIDADEQVISVVTSRGRGRTSGVELGKTHAGVWTIRDGKVSRVVWFPTREEALEAVGLREEAGGGRTP
jgi:ketosteroid isomerase-like protein